MREPMKGKLTRMGNQEFNCKNQYNEKLEDYQSIQDGQKLDKAEAKTAFGDYDAVIEKLENTIKYELETEMNKVLMKKLEWIEIKAENKNCEGKGFIYMPDIYTRCRCQMYLLDVHVICTC